MLIRTQEMAEVRRQYKDELNIKLAHNPLKVVGLWVSFCNQIYKHFLDDLDLSLITGYFKK